MKPTEHGRQEATWGFELPKAGEHVVQIQEGVEWTEKDDGRKSLMLPMLIIIGDQDAKFMHFVNVDPNDDKSMNRAAQQIDDILVCCGLADKFEKNFPIAGHFDPQVIEAYKIKLPYSGMMKVKLSHRTWKGNDGQERTNVQIDRISKYVPEKTKIPDVDGKKEPVPPTAQSARGSGGRGGDWGD